jgi:DNA-binding NtrC family response regulator
MMSGLTIAVPEATWAGPPDAELFDGMVGRSSAMRALFAAVRSEGGRCRRVLVTGESGSGKSVFARTIQRRWAGEGRPPLVLQCGTAQADRELSGRAHVGSLFVHDVSELSLSSQARLLQWLIETDMFVVASTTRSLEPRVAAGLFDAKLHRRLSAVRFTMPALRSRPEDILPLARFFAEECSLTCGTSRRRFTREADRALLAHDWPGNVRELRTVVLTVGMRGQGPAIDGTDFRGLIGTPPQPSSRDHEAIAS